MRNESGTLTCVFMSLETIGDFWLTSNAAVVVLRALLLTIRRFLDSAGFCTEVVA